MEGLAQEGRIRINRAKEVEGAKASEETSAQHLEAEQQRAAEEVKEKR